MLKWLLKAWLLTLTLIFVLIALTYFTASKFAGDDKDLINRNRTIRMAHEPETFRVWRHSTVEKSINNGRDKIDMGMAVEKEYNQMEEIEPSSARAEDYVPDYKIPGIRKVWVADGMGGGHWKFYSVPKPQLIE